MLTTTLKIFNNSFFEWKRNGVKQKCPYNSVGSNCTNNCPMFGIVYGRNTQKPKEEIPKKIVLYCQSSLLEFDINTIKRDN